MTQLPKITPRLSFPKIHLSNKNILIAISFVVLLILFFAARSYILSAELNKFKNDNQQLSKRLSSTQKELQKVEGEDQVVKNKKLEDEIKNIHDSYQNLIITYQDILDLKAQKGNTTEIDALFAKTLNYLSDKNYSSASATIATINNLVDLQTVKIVAASAPAPQAVTQSNNAPGSGYTRQAVSTDNGSFTVDIIAADLNSTRVILDTASDSDCKDSCPALSLATYVARSGAYAGINGTYFCPASYPTCAGKTNSFDLLVMNKNKHYFNSDNNVYSTNPAAIFSGGSARFVGQALEWGRDTGPDSVISNYPLLVSGGNITYTDGGDPKFLSKGPRDFIANKGSTVYIGTISNATMGDAAKVLKALGMDNAMNLDEGGSTALWFNGYIMGPGRDIPNAILFVRK